MNISVCRDKMAFYHGLIAISHLAVPAVGDKVQGKVTSRWTSRPRKVWNPLPKLIISCFFSLISAVCLNFEFYCCDQMLVPAPFPDQSQGLFFPHAE